MSGITRRQMLQSAGAAALALSPLSTIAARGPGSLQGAPPSNSGKLIVHEWGTFLCVQGSDGVTLGGMVASEEVLPSFVESRNIATWQRTKIRFKMETPVTYFYCDRPRSVEVRVDMPQGVLTHWYPMVRGFGPELSFFPGSEPAKSFLDWSRIELLPAGHVYRSTVIATTKGQVFSGLLANETKDQVELVQADGSVSAIALKDIEERHQGEAIVPTLWRVKTDDPWRFARQTDAALVRVRSRNLADWSEFDYEKFLFYRGLGTFDAPLETRASGPDAKLELTLRNRTRHALTGIFAVWVENKAIRYTALGDLAAGLSRGFTASALGQALPLEEGVPQAKNAVAEALVKAGLFRKEADAMVNSWEKSYFRTDGLRLLYLFPRETVDATIPIQIKPAPDQLVRVMVGRTEVLRPEQERDIEKWIAELGSNGFEAREAASRALARHGRLAEPALHRVAAVTRDAEVKRRALLLIEEIAGRE